MRSASLQVALLATSVLASCATVPISPNEPSDTPWTNYVIGKARTTPTGSTMIEGIDDARFLPGYVLTGELRVDKLGRQPSRDAGVWSAWYLYRGPCTGGRYLITNPRFYPGELGIIVAEDGSIPCEASVLQYLGAKRGREWRTPEAVGTRPFVPQPFPIDSRGLKWELVYSGRSANEIGLTYREYASGPDGTFARPAFYQDLKYDLSTSNRVVFRSIEIEILDASNAGVRFRVLRDLERLSPEAPEN